MVNFYTRLNQEQDNIYVSENKKVIKIMNRNSSEDTSTFYLPLILWIEEVSKTNFDESLDLSIIYISSNVSVILSDINMLSILAIKRGLDIQFDWHDSDDSFEISSNYTYSIQKLELKLKIKSIA